jgi:hypothetical protein
MARGDLIVFNEFLISMGENLINLETDTFLLGLITDSVTPVVDTATPTWDGTSSQEFDGNEVSQGGGYPLGGISVPNVVFERTGAVAKFDDDDTNISLAQNGSGFTNAFWGILYSDTSSAKNAVAFLELDGPISEQAGPININWNASGILTVTRT